MGFVFECACVHAFGVGWWMGFVFECACLLVYTVGGWVGLAFERACGLVYTSDAADELTRDCLFWLLSLSCLAVPQVCILLLCHVSTASSAAARMR